MSADEVVMVTTKPRASRPKPTPDERLLADIIDIAHCWVQASDGWYTKTCYERGVGPRRCCVNCRIIHRLAKRLAAS